MRKTRNLLFVLTIIMSVTHLYAQYGQGSYVFHLSDGSSVTGKIIEHTPQKSITIQTNDNHILTYNIASIVKITNGDRTNSRQNTDSDYKNPTTAFALSFLLPGLGQYYNGDIVTGIIQQTAFAAGLTMIFTGGFQWVQYSSSHWNGRYYEMSYYDEEEPTEWLYVGIGLASAAAIWSWIDAPLSASAKNKRARSYGHLLELENGGNLVGFDLVASSDNVSALLTVHF